MEFPTTFFKFLWDGSELILTIQEFKTKSNVYARNAVTVPALTLCYLSIKSRCAMITS